MTVSPDFDVVPVSPAHADGLAGLMASNGYGCFCRYWHFSGDARQWLARCAHTPEANKEEMQGALRAGSSEMLGIVATRPAVFAAKADGGERSAGAADAEVIGWLKLAPAHGVSKLYDQRLYKALPCFGGDRSGTFAIPCLLVREDVRRRGIARALLAAAIATAPRLGARSLEAFPRSDADVPGAALMTGPSKLFLDAGFEVIHDFAPYPVLRLQLEAA